MFKWCRLEWKPVLININTVEAEKEFIPNYAKYTNIFVSLPKELTIFHHYKGFKLVMLLSIEKYYQYRNIKNKLSTLNNLDFPKPEEFNLGWGKVDLCTSPDLRFSKENGFKMKDTTGHEKLKCLTEHTPLKTLVRFLFQGTHL